MTWSRRAGLGLACVVGAALVGPPVTTASPAPDGPRPAVRVSISQRGAALRIGDDLHFATTVTNTGPAPLSGLVAHLDVVSLRTGVYVDPEDWSSQRTRYLARLRRGQSQSISWSVTAVNSGEFAIYAVVLPGSAARRISSALAASPAIDARVAERRTLNSGGVVPLVLGVPGLIGLAALAVRRRRRWAPKG
jgi:uncharacterized repeat protein (TIGR01451 family)